jgi:hypothetical protein
MVRGMMVNSGEPNTTKYESYAEAWRRIKAATEAGFYLEAIAIQESMIFDRLRSFVEHFSDIEIMDKTPYSTLILHLEAVLNKDAKKERRWNNDKELIERLKKWGDRRNRAVHRIVRSKPGTPTQPIDEFLIKAQETAEQGAKLAREVSEWFRDQKKR